MNRFLLLSFLILSVCACGNKSSDNIDLAHSSKNALDWAGNYLGLLPCADCEGIKTHLSLSEDMSFVYETEYIGKDVPNTFSVRGTFEWLSDGNTIKLSMPTDSAPGLYKVGENALFHLDSEGKLIEGEMADIYMLSKTEKGITGNAWKVIQLANFSGKFPVERYPYFQIIKSGTNIVGLNGCNRISGQAKVNTEDNTVNFGNLITTKMACFGDDIETPFNAAIENAKKYKIDNGQLSFLSDSGEVLMTCTEDWLKTEM